MLSLSSRRKINMIKIDDIAREKIFKMMGTDEKPKLGIRVKISGKSADKYRHDLSFVTEENLKENDKFVETNAVRVYYDPADTEQLNGTIVTYFDDPWEGGFKVENPNTPTWNDPKAAEIQKYIESEINPGLAMHGGFVDLLDVRKDTVYVKMGGGCHGCSSVDVTMKQGIEQMIVSAFPAIAEVVDVTDHASGTNPYYQS
jgi:Fe/S biogenesis protein NfuA